MISGGMTRAGTVSGAQYGVWLKHQVPHVCYGDPNNHSETTWKGAPGLWLQTSLIGTVNRSQHAMQRDVVVSWCVLPCGANPVKGANIAWIVSELEFVNACRLRAVRAAAAGGSQGRLQEGHRIAAGAQHRGGRMPRCTSVMTLRAQDQYEHDNVPASCE